jgi:hypothetical protein
MVDLIDDLLPGLEFHQSGTVILSKFGERWAHVTEDLCIEGIAVEARRATAKELFCCEELLVNLESRFEADSGVVAFGHLGERLERHRLQQLRKATELRTGLIRIWSLTQQREFTKEMGKNNEKFLRADDW